MKKLFILPVTIIIFMVGCTQAKINHNYELDVIDIDSNPIHGARVDYELMHELEIIEISSHVTGEDGRVSASLQLLKDAFTFCCIKYKVFKKGYYPKTGEKCSQTTPKYDIKTIETVNEVIKLIKPIDYITNNFSSTLSDINLKTKVLNFIDIIIIQGLFSDSLMETKSIDLVTFKNNKYLRFKFINTNVYNSLKLDKYEIGKNIFDDVVRKLLSPLNEHIGDSNLFYGYDIIIIGNTMNFVDESKAKQIEYRFMIPESIVKEYKDKNISGQQVLDASVILMDDERIELKLQ